MNYHLAQINISRLLLRSTIRRSLNSSRNFSRSMRSRTKLWDSSGGCSRNPATPRTLPTMRNPFVIVNMSVWESIEPLREFAYKSSHREAFRDRAKWFEKAVEPGYCLWWIPSGHIPAVAEGRERLEHYQKHGATPHSFWFSQPFPQPTDEGVCV